MRYLNFLLILIVFGCYSGAHASNFNLTNETTPSCHTNGSVKKVDHKISKVSFQINNSQEKQSCCIEAVNYQVDYKSINPILTVSLINYNRLNNSFKYR